jgi:hypothetical protein
MKATSLAPASSAFCTSSRSTPGPSAYASLRQCHMQMFDRDHSRTPTPAQKSCAQHGRVWHRAKRPVSLQMRMLMLSESAGYYPEDSRDMLEPRCQRLALPKCLGRLKPEMICALSQQPPAQRGHAHSISNLHMMLDT